MLLVAVGGAIGWLLAPEPRSLLIAGEPVAAIRTHLAGWIAAVAVVRGAGYADPSDDEERVWRRVGNLIEQVAEVVGGQPVEPALLGAGRIGNFINGELWGRPADPSLPWAVVFRQLGLFGLIEMIIFIVILLVGYVYAWKKGALEWE